MSCCLNGKGTTVWECARGNNDNFVLFGSLDCRGQFKMGFLLLNK